VNSCDEELIFLRTGNSSTPTSITVKESATPDYLYYLSAVNVSSAQDSNVARLEMQAIMSANIYTSNTRLTFGTPSMEPTAFYHVCTSQVSMYIMFFVSWDPWHLAF